tara:strand:- start:89 stop:496 length:408 start_codon:yes stop_codon:yes gene_type:complete
MFRKNTTKQRSQRRADGESDVLDRQIRTSLAQRNEVAENHLGEEINATSTQTLHNSTKDKHGARLRCTADGASASEDGDSKHHWVLSSPHVAELAIQGLEDGAREEKGGSDPRELGAEIKRFRNSGERGIGDAAL